jgi:hypothetical protein
MDQLTIIPTTYRDAPASLVIGSELEAVISLRGGHLAALRLRGEPLSPLWVPPWPAADPRSVVPSAQGAYGDGAEAYLLAGICGSNLCCDRFGAPWPGESRPLHGEAGVSSFTRIDHQGHTCSISAYLPQARLTVERRIALQGNTCVLSTRVRHQGGAQRAIEWCEHTNLGPPFLDDVEIQADVDAAWNLPGEPEPGYAHYSREAEIPLGVALPVPAAHAPATGTFACARVRTGEQASWSATSQRLGRRLTVRFSPQEFPWLGLWTQHGSRQTPPWSGRTRVRGMELSTKPFPEGKPPMVRALVYRGRPTTCLVPPGAGLEKTLRFTWERLSQG